MCDKLNETALTIEHTAREAVLAKINAALPPGQRWRLFWDKPEHAANVKQAWTIGLIQFGGDNRNGLFVAVVEPGNARADAWRWHVGYGTDIGQADTIEEACDAAREMARVRRMLKTGEEWLAEQSRYERLMTGRDEVAVVIVTVPPATRQGR